jgi:hypothetical protein
LTLNKSSTITNVFGGNFQPNSNISFIVSVDEVDEPKSFLFTKDNYERYTQFKSFNDTYIVIGDFDGDRRIEILYNDEIDHELELENLKKEKEKLESSIE